MCVRTGNCQRSEIQYLEFIAIAILHRARHSAVSIRSQSRTRAHKVTDLRSITATPLSSLSSLTRADLSLIELEHRSVVTHRHTCRASSIASIPPYSLIPTQMRPCSCALPTAIVVADCHRPSHSVVDTMGAGAPALAKLAALLRSLVMLPIAPFFTAGFVGIDAARTGSTSSFAPLAWRSFSGRRI